MDISNFTYIAGFASLLSLILQLLNSLKKYSKIRNVIFFIIYGVFIGSVINAFDSSSIKIDITVNGLTILTTIFLVATFWSFILSNITEDSGRSGQLAAFGGTFLVIFVVLLLANVISKAESPYEQEKNALNISELILLADENERKTNFDRAVMHLESVKRKISKKDSRMEAIEKRIEDIKLKQFQ